MRFPLLRLMFPLMLQAPRSRVEARRASRLEVFRRRVLSTVDTDRPGARLQPAARASDSVQNHRSPCDVLMRVSA